ncbi:MAG TPA: antitoxin [Kiritimatiellia bacterium]|nr:antitoxin [Kiritimatiellia bacterium]
MTTNVLSVTEAVRNFSEYVNRVAYRHESFVLRKGNKDVAELRPVPAGRLLGDLPSILRTLPQLGHDDAEAFARDVDHAREALQRSPLGDPWAS